MCGKFSAIGLCQAVFICIMKVTSENKLKYAQQNEWIDQHINYVHQNVYETWEKSETDN